jgi:ribosomal-protein-alanine N-acetyltransferase
MEIRAATLDDVLAICELEAELFPDNCFNEVTLSNEIVQGSSWVVYIGKVLAGYVMMQNDGVLNDIIRLGVAKSFQGRGLGSQLLKQALEKKNGPVILTVKAQNWLALRLYKKYGFELVGCLDEGWVMQHA